MRKDRTTNSFMTVDDEVRVREEGVKVPKRKNLEKRELKESMCQTVNKEQ